MDLGRLVSASRCHSEVSRWVAIVGTDENVLIRLDLYLCCNTLATVLFRCEFLKKMA